jgi:8-oxo-dGTP diphosphatase
MRRGVTEPVETVKRNGYQQPMSIDRTDELQPAVSVALQRGKTLLLVQRAHEPAKGQWAFAGGRVEPGEALEAAARRELLEETGMLAGPLSTLSVMELGRFRLAVFSGDALPGEPVASDDAAAAGFFTLAEIDAMNATQSTKQCARMVLGDVANAGDGVRN